MNANAKLSQLRFWPSHLFRQFAIKTIPHSLHVSFKSASLYHVLKAYILVNPDPQLKNADLKHIVCVVLLELS